MEYQILGCPQDLKLVLTKWDLTKMRENDAHTIAGLCSRNGALISIRVETGDNELTLTCSHEPVCRRS